MRSPFRSRRNRHRKWWDRLGERVFGSSRNPLTAYQVKCRAVAVVAFIMPYVVFNHGQVGVRFYKDTKGRFDASIADGLRKNGDADGAISRLIHAQMRTPHLPEIWRGLGWAASSGFPIQARYYLEKLENENRLEKADALLLADLCLRLEDPARAAGIYQQWVDKLPSDPDVWSAWARACHLRGDLSEAAKSYSRVLVLAPHHLLANVGMADILLRSGTSNGQKVATSILLNQLKRAVGARLPSAHELAALAVDLPMQEEAQRTELAGLLSRLDEGSAVFKLASIFLGHPESGSEVDLAARRSEVRSFLSANRDLAYAERKQVAGWLQKHGENGLLLEWVSLADAAGDEVLFGLRMDSLLTSGQWREAAEMALHPAAGPLSEKGQWLQTLVALRSGRETPVMAEMLLRNAMSEVAEEDNLAACTAIGFASLDHGVFSLATEAFGRVMRHGANTSVPLKEYVHAARRSGFKAAQALEMLGGKAEALAASSDVKKLSVYLRLLCGQEIECAAIDLAELKRANPEDPYVKFLHAFMGYRLGDYAGSVRSLLPLPSHRWHQGETVVIATILASGGQLQQAAKLASKVTGQGVFPEESKLLDSWKARAELDLGLLSSVTTGP